jgi:hypothetical protein
MSQSFAACRLRRKVTAATITRKFLQTSAVKLQVNTVASLAKFVIEMGDGSYLDELAEHHSATVNPCKMAVSHATFEAIVSNIPGEFILCRLALACSAYSADKMECRMPPMPDLCRLWSLGDLQALAKQLTNLRAAEAFLRLSRKDHMDAIAQVTSTVVARTCLRSLSMATVRMLCGKGPLPEFAFGSNSGQTAMFEDRLKTLRIQWMTHVKSLHPEVPFDVPSDMTADDFARVDYDGEHVRADSKVSEILAAGFKVNGDVKLLKRKDVLVQHGRLREKHKCVLRAGDIGKILSVAADGLKVRFTAKVLDKEHQIDLDLPMAAVSLGDSAAEASEKKDVGPAMPAGFEFARKPCQKAEICEWAKPADVSQQICNLKSTVGFIMGVVASLSPKYSADDFCIVLRDRQTEVWAMRAFKACEILLCPETTELKDVYWTQNKSVKVMNAELLHPDKRPIALDGRLRSTPNEGRMLSLFFCVSRCKESSDEAAACNMRIHYPSVSCAVELDFALPTGKKRQHSIAFKQQQTPQVPVMFNPAGVKAHTMLMCLDDAVLAAWKEQEKTNKLQEVAAGVKAAAGGKK